MIALDTETTGLDPNTGHLVIEIGVVEMINRMPTENHYHQHQPEREVDEGLSPSTASRRRVVPTN